MNIKKHIPNAITCLNLLSGALAVVYALHEQRLDIASCLIVLAAVFDFFDGLVARALGVTSPIGKDLDSLADVLSFGLAPAIVMSQGLWHSGASFEEGLIPLIIVAFAALRLAKFNNDTRQTTSFIGLPVPSNALFWIGLQSVLPSLKLLVGHTTMLAVVAILVVLFCYLMVSELPMFSFKLKGLKGSTNQIALVIISLVAILYWGAFGFSVAILAYILLSILQTMRSTNEARP